MYNKPSARLEYRWKIKIFSVNKKSHINNKKDIIMVLPVKKYSKSMISVTLLKTITNPRINNHDSMKSAVTRFRNIISIV